MESSQASGPAFPPPRRVFTAPTYSSAPQSSSSSQSNSGVVETLYDHPSVKIITFTASSRHYSLGGTGLSQGPDVAPGSLSWSSQLERTIAVGQFRIYRAPGSVAFLNCGSALQPILPKSQVWCVDEVSSKFILQIRRPQYWRIEVPVANEEDIQRALLLRQVFDQILQFEKTECPFKRSFTVELPELPQTPVKKRPWTPAQRPFPALPPTPDHTPVELARVRRDLPKFGPIVISETPEILSDPGKSLDQIEESQVSPKTIPSLTETSTREGDPEENSDEALQLGEAAEEYQPVPEALKLGTTFPALRSVTAPPQLTFHASPPSKVREEEGQIERPRNASSSPSPADSQSSFHSVTSWNASSLPPSPPLSNPASPLGLSCPSEVDGEPLGQEDSPELASISNSSPTWSACPSSDYDSSLTAPSSINEAVETSSASSETVVEENTPQTPHRTKEKLVETSTPAVSDSPLSEPASEVTRRRPSIRRRGTTSSSISASRRALSPLPSAANLFAPRRPLTRSPTKGKLDVVRRLPLAIIQTTCEILMSPPSHLINLMLKVAARIAAGEWRGFVFGTDEQGERIPVHWDWSDDEDAESPSPYPALRKNSLGWLPLTGQIMAGTFPESDDEDNDHHEKEIKITQTTSNKLVTSTEIDRMGDHLHEPPSPTAPLDTVRSEDLSESLGVD